MKCDAKIRFLTHGALWSFLVIIALCFNIHLLPAFEKRTDLHNPSSNSDEEIYNQYISFFERVYDTMDKNYYLPVTREAFDRFIDKFNREIYDNLKKKGEKSNYINWRSAAYLVDYLKSPEDKFSAFYPPKAADTFEKKALGKQVDLGIEGKLTSAGFLVSRVEPRSDAYEQGLREEDVITKIDKAEVVTLTEEAILKLLIPLVDSRVVLAYVDHIDKSQKEIDVISKEYFKQSVFTVPVDIPGVFCLSVQTFNRKTSEDMLRYLMLIEEKNPIGLILDLRGNPGGPPLAAEEISAFFLPPDEELAYFQKKGKPRAMLKVPQINSQYRYDGFLAVLVNEKSGSASELFSGVLQRYKRAVLIGTPTAGKVMLKSMFDFDDGSMLLLVTARGHFYDGTVFDFNGLAPDIIVEDETIDLVHMAALKLMSKKTDSEKKVK